MGKTALELSAKEWKAFRPAEAVQRHKADRQADMKQRREAAWQVARKAASLLKDQFSASRVVVFGSLAHADWFTPWSDIDLAAWGIPPGQFFLAVATITGLDSDLRIELVDPENCRPGLLKNIEQEGIEL